LSKKEVPIFGGLAFISASEQLKNLQKALIGWKKATSLFGLVNYLTGY